MGIGGVLSVFRDNKDMPIAFHYRQLRPQEKNYSASEIECLVIVDTIRHFEAYLVGRKFILDKDHQALEYLATKKSPNKRLTRWSLFLQEFNFELKYRPGSRNSNADGLSRQNWEDNNSTD